MHWLCRKIYTILNPEGRQMSLSSIGEDSASASLFKMDFNYLGEMKI